MAQEDLRDLDAVLRERLAIALHQEALPSRRGRLQSRHLRRALLHAEVLNAERDGAARDEDDVAARLTRPLRAGGAVGQRCTLTSPCELLGENRKHPAFRRAQTLRADLDDKAAAARQKAPFGHDSSSANPENRVTARRVVEGRIEPALEVARQRGRRQEQVVEPAGELVTQIFDAFGKP